MCNKKWWQRVIILAAGVFNNFLLAIIILFFMALIWGANSLEPRVGTILEDSAAEAGGLQAGDLILSVNDHKVSTWDQTQIVLYLKNDSNVYEFEVLRDGKTVTLEFEPDVTETETGEEQKTFGFGIEQKTEKGLWASIKYAFERFWSLISTMWITVINLFTGQISLSSLSGPVGIYHVVGESLSMGLQQIVYLIAFLSINVGLINILPIPAFDGGRILFLIIEKIKGSPINAKFENACHMVFFFLIILLMIYITVFDIIRFT